MVLIENVGFSLLNRLVYEFPDNIHFCYTHYNAFLSDFICV